MLSAHLKGPKSLERLPCSPSYPHTMMLSLLLPPGSQTMFSPFSSVAQSCPTLCDPTDYSTLGFPVHHQFLKPIQIHVHCVGDAIQPSHSPSSPSPTLMTCVTGAWNIKDSSIQWEKLFPLSLDIEKKKKKKTSLVVQWLRIRLPVQGTWVQSLVQEDSTCCGATKPMCHNYRSSML